MRATTKSSSGSNIALSTLIHLAQDSRPFDAGIIVFCDVLSGSLNSIASGLGLQSSSFLVDSTGSDVVDKIRRTVI